MNQCYYNGDFYQCINATSASPADEPESWVKVKLLGKWRWVLAQLTYANLLRLDGQTDKAAVENSVARGRDRVGLDDLVRQEANEEQRFTSARGRMTRLNTGRTRPVSAGVILDDAYRLIGWDADQLDTRELQDARMALSQAVQEVWEAWWWQELMVCERRTFADTLGQSEINTLTIDDNGYTCYWQQTDKYYFTTSDNPNVNPTDIHGTRYAGSWLELNFDARPEAWSPTTLYSRADVVYWNDTNWALFGSPTSQGVEPVFATEWVELPSDIPVLPFTNHAGEMVGPFGPIRSISKYDPRTSANPNCYELDLVSTGTRVRNLTVGKPYVWWRRVTPILTGDDFDPDVTYEAVDPQDLVFDKTDSTGVFSVGSGIFANP